MNLNQDLSAKPDRHKKESDAQRLEYERRRRVRAWISLLFLAPGLAMLVYFAVVQLGMLFSRH